MSTATAVNTPGQDLARKMSLFEIDEGLAALVESAQESFAELARREEERLHTRRKATENRVKSLKNFLCFWMLSRSCKHLKGRLNTITLSKNSVDSLVVEEGAQIPNRYYKVTVQMDRDEWTLLMNMLPDSPFRERLVRDGATQKGLNGAQLQEAVAAGVELPGVRLLRGHHVRLT